MSRVPVVNLKTIAAQTNLSVATVSRILRGKDQCSDQTRARVTDAARRLRYRPNLLVQGLQKGRTQTIGVLVHIGDEFFARIAEGIHDGLVSHDHVPIFLWSRSHQAAASLPAADPSAASNPATPGFPGLPAAATDSPRIAPSELDQIHRLVDRRVDGIILHPRSDSIDDSYLHEVWDRGIPLVTIDRELQATHADFVGTDDEAGGRLAAEYLLSLGHRRLGHLAGPQKVTTAFWRRRSFELTARAAGAIVQTIEDPSYGDIEAYDAARRLLALPLRPTAVFCASDFQVGYLYRAAAEMNLRVPDHLSVLGYADLEIARRLVPTVSTVRQDPYEMGKRAAQLLIQRLEALRQDNTQSSAPGAISPGSRATHVAQSSADQASRPEPIKFRLQPTLVVRGSTTPPAESEHMI